MCVKCGCGIAIVMAAMPTLAYANSGVGTYSNAAADHISHTAILEFEVTTKSKPAIVYWR